MNYKIEIKKLHVYNIEMENQTLGENSVKFKNLFDLLQTCKTNKENTNKKATNTRIGSKNPKEDNKSRIFYL